jgi:hypothetical protein
MSTPTNQNQNTLTPQAGVKMTGPDEYGKPVSGPATALAKVAGALSNVPGIGLYARASQLALSTVADVASLFGYCRPAEEASIVPYRPAYVGNMPQTNVPDSVTKLTTDLKQETVVDPRTVGLSGVDELNIRSIVTRESYLTKFPWAISATQGTRLATFGVTPINWDEFQAPLITEYHMTPACHTGMLFENWRGTMKYRFQVVASNFHKGRLQVQYDPHDSTENEFNVAYNRVIDISEEKDFTIEVGWGIPETYGETRNPGISGLSFRNDGSDRFFPVNNPNFYNGQISIWVLNDLTVPNSDIDNDIEINCFVSCGDDFEFANPTDEQIRDFTWFADPTLLPQAGEEPLVAPDHDETEDPSRPVNNSPDTVVGGELNDFTNPLAAICFGESITSIRSMMKRFTLYSIWNVPPNSPDSTFMYTRRSMNFPLPRGYAPNGIHTGVTGPYNYVKQTILGWYSPCFQGWRGGIRRKTVATDFQSPGNGLSKGVMNYRRIASPGFGHLTDFQSLVVLDTETFYARQIGEFPLGASGQQSTPYSMNPVLEVEFPYHSNLRFHPTRPLQPNAQPALEYENSNEFKLFASQKSSAGGPCMIEYIAAGDDFSLFFFTNVPVCYYNPTDPV